MQGLPLGKLMRAASSINAFEADQATSLVFWILNFQVIGDFAACDVFSITSFSLRIVTVFSLVFAWLYLLFCSAVKHCSGFCNSPEPTTTILAGVVTAYSMSPYSR